jgi:hypothetical protein
MIFCRVTFEAELQDKPLFSAKSAEPVVVALVEIDEGEIWCTDFRLHGVFPGPKHDKDSVSMKRFLELIKTDSVKRDGIKVELAWKKPVESVVQSQG